MFDQGVVRPFFGYIASFDRYESKIAMPSSWFEFIVSMNVAVRWGEAGRCEYVPSSCRPSSVFLHGTGLWLP